MSELTLRERVAQLELEREIEGKQLNEIKIQLTKTSDMMLSMSSKIDEMYPIVKDVMMVREYGSFTWRALKWLGAVTFTVIVSWHMFKDGIKDFITYIFR